MEPITHFLTGACIGRAGFNRKTAYATLAAVLAAEAADIDILWGLAGPVEELKHHRGITHTFLAVPVIAGVVVGAVWLWRRWRNKAGPASFHAGWLYLTALAAALSHILLDWTNNYGVRPFYPFNPRWYAGSILFIVEPVFWALLFLALAMPWLLGLADREIGVRKKPFRGRGWAVFALAGMTAIGCWRWAEREQGLAMMANAQVTGEPALRMTLEPYPVNPYRWHAIVETRDDFQTAEVNTWNPSAADAIVSDPHADVIYKPAVTPAVEAAKQTLLGRVYLDWGRWAVVRDLGQEPAPGMIPPELPPGRTWTTVQFTDLRFDYPFLGTRSGRSAARPLTGWVYIVDGREEAGMAMSGREQK
ncbi:MAG TPA: metal-dependent hydrolase [Terracidiphilus sp.]|jgi:inner membrane protein|nr:metal-dependent hydrolase [Terracidiphilus sp.]